MSIRFSLVYPTRHRPEFVAKALEFLELQDYRNFEVIVSDNFVDPALACEEQCSRYKLGNLRYVRPPQPLGMVDNWNYPLQFATGDYICYLTDKMFLLPDTLSQASQCIESQGAEIVNWVESAYLPSSCQSYFGKGTWIGVADAVKTRPGYLAYDPRAALSARGRADISRMEQGRFDFARGKINYGAYSSELVKQIVGKTGALFHRISPDYTSMILGLSMATTAAETPQPGVVHVHSDLSNGGQAAIRDEVAYRFISELGGKEETLGNLLVPGLYCSSHNVVSHDFIALKRKFGLDFDFNPTNWLVYILEDLDREGRTWSTVEVEWAQKKLVSDFLGGLHPSEQALVSRRLAQRSRERRNIARYEALIGAVKSLLPERLVGEVRSSVRSMRRLPHPHPCDRIEDILTKWAAA